SLRGHRVSGEAAEVELHAGLIALGPGVVARRYVKDGTGRELDDCAVLHAHGHPPRQAVSDVADLAILGSRYGFDVIRPFPPRLERGQADVTGAQVNQVDAPVPGERANLVGSIEPLRFRLAHRFTPYAHLFRRFPRESPRQESRSSRRSAQS